MNPSRRILAVVVAGSFATLAACGGESGPIAAPDDRDSSADDVAPDTLGPQPSDPSEAPLATISPDLPEELEGAVGPVLVQGDPLPPYPANAGAVDPAFDVEAPVIAGKDFEGRTVRIDAFAGGPTMVVFLAHWCPHCNDEIPVINELRDSGQFPDGLNVVGVSTAVNAGRPNFPPGRWLEQKDWSYPVIVDGIDFERETFIAADALGVSGFPFTVLIDGDGTVQARWSGGRAGSQIIDIINANLTFG